LGVEALLDFVPTGCTPVLVDLIEGATSLPDYVHPERAFYIFGPEDGTLDPARFAAVKEVIYVPTLGCMNLAASVNVILYDRLAKRLRAKG
ncbi:23S rRNA methyltransferase, partial [Aeromonas salmonicida subsp. salmonicida]